MDTSELVEGVLDLPEIALVTVSQNDVSQNVIKARNLVKFCHIILSVANVGLCVHRNIVESVLSIDDMNLGFIAVYLTLNSFVNILQIEHYKFPCKIVMIIIDSNLVLPIRELSVEFLVCLIKELFEYQILQTL